MLYPRRATSCLVLLLLAGCGGGAAAGRGPAGAATSSGGDAASAADGATADAPGMDRTLEDAARGASVDATVATAVIIDTHTHFWDLGRNPGFSDGKTRLPTEYEKLARPAGITGTVVIEAVWRNLADNMWGLDLAENNTIIVGVMGHLTIGAPTFKDDLDTLAKSRFFRGLRVGASDLKVPGIKLLADGGFAADVDIAGSVTNLRSVAADASGLPKLKIVLDHAAGLGFGGDPAPDLAAALAMAAQSPNVYCKVSRFQEQAGSKPAPTDAAAYQKALDFLWKTFGEDRLIFGTNWPLLESAGTLADAVKIMQAYFDAKGKTASEKFFWRNAKAVYQWVER